MWLQAARPQWICTELNLGTHPKISIFCGEKPIHRSPSSNQLKSQMDSTIAMFGGSHPIWRVNNAYDSELALIISYPCPIPRILSQFTKCPWPPNLWIQSLISCPIPSFLLLLFQLRGRSRPLWGERLQSMHTARWDHENKQLIVGQKKRIDRFLNNQISWHCQISFWRHLQDLLDGC